MTDLEKYLAIQRAKEIADKTITQAAERTGAQWPAPPTCLVSSFAKRSDVPYGTQLVRMAPNVEAALAGKGLYEPISLSRLPGYWWKANADAAEVGQFSEYGCRFVTLFLSSERLATTGYEVVDGPFEPWANVDVARAMLSEKHGKYWDANISNRPLLPVVEGTEPYEGRDNSYSSEALLVALDEGKTIKIYSGPYDTEDAAHYALDLRWESPE